MKTAGHVLCTLLSGIVIVTGTLAGCASDDNEDELGGRLAAELEVDGGSSGSAADEPPYDPYDYPELPDPYYCDENSDGGSSLSDGGVGFTAFSPSLRPLSPIVKPKPIVCKPRPAGCAAPNVAAASAAGCPPSTAQDITHTVNCTPAPIGNYRNAADGNSTWQCEPSMPHGKCVPTKAKGGNASHLHHDVTNYNFNPITKCCLKTVVHDSNPVCL